LGSRRAIVDSRVKKYKELSKKISAKAAQLNEIEREIRVLHDERSRLTTGVFEDGMSCCYWCGKLTERASGIHPRHTVCGDCWQEMDW
jgi:hypothetical protein